MPRFSKDDLQRELDLSRCRLRAGNLAGVVNWSAAFIEDRGIAAGPAGRREVGAVEEVENFGTQLQIDPIRSLLDVVVLEERQIQVHERWADQ